MASINYNKFHINTERQTKIITDNNFTYRLLLKEINKYIKSKSKVLDIGCGAGTISFYFSGKVSSVLGIDISERAIESATQSAHVLGLKNAKFETMEFPNKSPKGRFDFIIFTEVIEHLEDDNKAIKQITKSLNENGILLLSTPSKNAPLHRLGYAKGFDNRVGHLRRYGANQLVLMCKDNGLEVLEIKKIEGIIRNFLFLSPVAGKLVRFVKFYISDLVTFIDNLTVPILGESNIIIVAKKR